MFLFKFKLFYTLFLRDYLSLALLNTQLQLTLLHHLPYLFRLSFGLIFSLLALIQLRHELYDIFREPIMLYADIMQEIDNRAHGSLMLFEVYPVLLVWLDEPLAHEMLLVEFYFVCHDIQGF